MTIVEQLLHLQEVFDEDFSPYVVTDPLQGPAAIMRLNVPGSRNTYDMFLEWSVDIDERNRPILEHLDMMRQNTPVVTINDPRTTVPADYIEYANGLLNFRDTLFDYLQTTGDVLSLIMNDLYTPPTEFYTGLRTKIAEFRDTLSKTPIAMNKVYLAKYYATLLEAITVMPNSAFTISNAFTNLQDPNNPLIFRLKEIEDHCLELLNAYEENSWLVHIQAPEGEFSSVLRPNVWHFTGSGFRVMFVSEKENIGYDDIADVRLVVDG